MAMSRFSFGARLVATAGFVVVAAASAPLPRAASQDAKSPAVSAPSGVDAASATMFKTYCVGCHNDRARTGGLSLEAVSATSPEGAEVLERVLRKLRMDAMPPPGRPRPDPAQAQAVIASLETQLDSYAASRPRAGRAEALHRLNRAEYQNAVRDLVGLEIEATSFLPPDGADAHGFDNNAAMLSISPALLDAYTRAATRISRLAMGIPPELPLTETSRVPLALDQNGYISEDLPFGSRGGYSFRHDFPASGEYTLRIHLRRTLYGYIIGLIKAHEVDVRVDRQLVARTTVGGEDHGTRRSPWSYYGDITGDKEFETYNLTADEKLVFKFAAKAGPALIGISFDNRFVEREDGPYPPPLPERNERDEEGSLELDRVTITGPYGVAPAGDMQSRRKILTCRPQTAREEDSCAKQILESLALRAYRRPPTAEEVGTLVAFYRKGRLGESFDRGIQFALERLLVDPNFLFRVEQDPPSAAPGSAYRLAPFELASRLSFFLWSSIPDEELLKEASRGTLGDPVVLEKQVRRMLADPRSSALVDNFVNQWLLLRNIGGFRPDPTLFRAFDENLRQSMELETKRFVSSTIETDASVVDLLAAKYTFLNERLAKHYGIKGVYGPRMRRYEFGQSDPRGGLLGHGSLLAVTSYPNRTSPVLRGKWVLESLLGTPPPPPPPTVQAGLPDSVPGAKTSTVRQRLELHRKNPVCASCHASMDPLGFALESFDAVGAFRVKSESGDIVDASAVLPNGTSFEGPTGLRTFLLGKREQFVRALTERLLAYAIGRGAEAFDQSTVRQIVREAKPRDYRWSAIIMGIVKSEPFQMRTARAAAPRSANAAKARTRSEKQGN